MNSEEFNPQAYLNREEAAAAEIVRKLRKALDRGDHHEVDAQFDKLEDLVNYERPEVVLNLTLSGGGPSSGLVILLSRDTYPAGYSAWSINTVHHWVSYGGAQAKRQVLESEGLYLLAERHVERFVFEEEAF